MFEPKRGGEAGYNQEMFGEPARGRKQRDAFSVPGAAGQAEELLARQLGPGETVVWQGRPEKLHAAGGSFGRLFGWFWLGFACFWELMALGAAAQAGAFGLVFPLFGVPFIIIGLYLVFPNFMGKRRLAGTVYALTNRRALVVSRRRVTAWPLGSIESVEKRYYADGTGDLVLENGQTRLTGNNGHVRSVTLEFLGIADPDGAEAALRDRLMPP